MQGSDTVQCWCRDGAVMLPVRLSSREGLISCIERCRQGHAPGAGIGQGWGRDGAGMEQGWGRDGVQDGVQGWCVGMVCRDGAVMVPHPEMRTASRLRTHTLMVQ